MIKIISSTVGMEKFQRCDHSSYVATAELNRAKVLKLRQRQKWMGRVRGADGRQRWIRATDLRPASPRLILI